MSDQIPATICPECRDGKHQNCDLSSWNFDVDAECACSCASAEHSASASPAIRVAPGEHLVVVVKPAAYDAASLEEISGVIDEARRNNEAIFFDGDRYEVFVVPADSRAEVIAGMGYPVLDERYAAADEWMKGSQLTAPELTPRVKTEMSNAFAGGPLWLYGRRRRDAVEVEAL